MMMPAIAIADIKLPSFANANNAESQIDKTFTNVFEILQLIGGGILVLALVIAAIVWIMSDDKGDEAKQRIKNVLIGGAILASATALPGFIFS